MVTVPVPAVVKFTAPVKAFALPNVILKSLPDVMKLDVPDTVIAPDCEMAPALVIDNVPLDCAMPAMLNAPEFTKVILPAAVVVALKLSISLLALLMVVLPPELVVSDPIVVNAPAV